MDSSDKLLGEYLRARREVTTPVQAGLPLIGSRRTPGLRREEVAMLAGVSVHYYTRLEQGRERGPSDQVLSALARVLRLEDEAARHLFELAHPAARPRHPVDRRERVSPSLLRLLEGWQHTPAFVVGRRMDVLAANPLVRALYDGFSLQDNCLRMVFLTPEAENFYLDWEEAAACKTAALRATVGSDHDDPLLAELINELSAHSPAFRRMWARHDVRNRGCEVKRFRHPEVGEMHLSAELFTISGAPGQQLVVLAAEPGSPSERALVRLGHVAAEKNGAAGGGPPVPLWTAR
ncbi:transcriptional regulator [Microtetraspora sp. NBRC 13810]|uniref:helix-turn-helix domain-containing protein n=1 Tax=Microtetraspora sp. NBRC 13810 TaxID=3030990 RepID=UPI0024A13D06|nr:helix-turn-helix transcriptional regulator [Microtetraspora sp. NBRC 13810]GLW05706.1 transcriptional regulator [Microtetraspora sp. NBRC 13810]